MKEALDMIIEVLRDPQRIDRYLCLSDTGHYTSDNYTNLSLDGGIYLTPHVRIPADRGCTDEEARETAEALIWELDQPGPPAHLQSTPSQQLRLPSCNTSRG